MVSYCPLFAFSPLHIHSPLSPMLSSSSLLLTCFSSPTLPPRRRFISCLTPLAMNHQDLSSHPRLPLLLLEFAEIWSRSGKSPDFLMIAEALVCILRHCLL